jgi:hypothetical protein
MSMMGEAAVEEPELASPELLPVEVLEDAAVVELASPELVSSGRDVTLGVVVKLVVAPGPLQAKTLREATTTERGSMAAKSSAKMRGGQVRRLVAEHGAALFSSGCLSEDAGLVAMSSGLLP